MVDQDKCNILKIESKMENILEGVQKRKSCLYRDGSVTSERDGECMER